MSEDSSEFTMGSRWRPLRSLRILAYAMMLIAPLTIILAAICVEERVDEGTITDKYKEGRWNGSTYYFILDGEKEVTVNRDEWYKYEVGDHYEGEGEMYWDWNNLEAPT